MKILIIGFGLMGQAFARHLSRKHQVYVYDAVKDFLPPLQKEIDFQIVDELDMQIKDFNVIILAVKPKDLGDVAEEITPYLGSNTILISMLAGITTKTLNRYFPDTATVRIMPNLSLTKGSGVIGIAKTAEIDEKRKAMLEEILEGMGIVAWMGENHIDALTALTGSGPAFFAEFVEASIQAGVLLGISHDESRKFIMQMIKGTLMIMEEDNLSTLDLKKRVSSPGGTTIQGLYAMEKHGMRYSVVEGYHAAFLRAKELSKDFSE